MTRRLYRGLLILTAVAYPTTGRADDWPQWLGPQRDAIWREGNILAKFPAGGPTVRWRTPIGGGYAGPAVAEGRVYVMDRQRKANPQGAPAKKGLIPGTERILCLDASGGKVHWTHEYDCPYVNVSYPSGPRTTPIIHQGRVYALGTMGDLCCLDAVTGKVHWTKNLAKEYHTAPPVWGWSSHLLLDGDKLISLVGGEGSAVVAFAKDSGKELWRALTTEEVGYAPPMIFTAGGKRQLIIWTSESVNALDPETGRLYWKELHPADGKPRRPAVNIATPRQLGDLLLISTAYHGSLMLKLAAENPAATVLWRGKSSNSQKPDGLHALMAAPIMHDGHIYGVGGGGELVCIEAATGKQLWETFAATGGKRAFCATAFLVQQDDRFFIFNELGDLIVARLTPKRYEELDRAHLLEPTQGVQGRQVVWSHPAFADRCMYARNDKEIICVELAGKRPGDLAMLQGSWNLVSAERDGNRLPEDEVKKTRISFKDDAFIFPDASGIGTSRKGTIRVDPTKQPKWMDSTAAGEAGKEAVSLGIYEIRGDDYKVCFAPPGKERPKAFGAQRETGHIFQTWKRAPGIELTGMLRTGVVAIGGETTGIVMVTKEGKYELDLGKNKELHQKVEKLNGKLVTVAGTLEIRKGVEVKERKIVTVVRVEEAKAK